ncbi:hypothetical protein D3C79_692750 [compost metagenome]
MGDMTDNGRRVIGLSDALVMHALGLAHPSKTWPDHKPAGGTQVAGQRNRDDVQGATAQQRLWVTDQYYPPGRAGRVIDQQMDVAHRPVYEDITTFSMWHYKVLAIKAANRRLNRESGHPGWKGTKHHDDQRNID